MQRLSGSEWVRQLRWLGEGPDLVQAQLLAQEFLTHIEWVKRLDTMDEATIKRCLNNCPIKGGTITPSTAAIEAAVWLLSNADKGVFGLKLKLNEPKVQDVGGVTYKIRRGKGDFKKPKTLGKVWYDVHQ